MTPRSRSEQVDSCWKALRLPVVGAAGRPHGHCGHLSPQGVSGRAGQESWRRKPIGFEFRLICDCIREASSAIRLSICCSMKPWIGLGSTGPGVAVYQSWIVSLVVVIGLVGLAWSTLRPTRPATRAEVPTRVGG